MRTIVSNDRGDTWTPQPTPFETGEDDARLAVSSQGVIALVTAAPDEQGRRAIAFATSEDAGASWSTPLVLAQAAGDGAASPQVAALGEAFVVTGYLMGPDQSARPTMWRIEGGAISSLPLGPPAGSNEMGGAAGWPRLGDYSGLATAAADAWALWVAGEGADTDLYATRVAWL